MFVVGGPGPLLLGCKLGVSKIGRCTGWEDRDRGFPKEEGVCRRSVGFSRSYGCPEKVVLERRTDDFGFTL